MENNIHDPGTDYYYPEYYRDALEALGPTIHDTNWTLGPTTQGGHQDRTENDQNHQVHAKQRIGPRQRYLPTQPSPRPPIQQDTSNSIPENTYLAPQQDFIYVGHHVSTKPTLIPSQPGYFPLPTWAHPAMIHKLQHSLEVFLILHHDFVRQVFQFTPKDLLGHKTYLIPRISNTGDITVAGFAFGPLPYAFIHQQLLTPIKRALYEHIHKRRLIPSIPFEPPPIQYISADALFNLRPKSSRLRKQGAEEITTLLKTQLNDMGFKCFLGKSVLVLAPGGVEWYQRYRFSNADIANGEYLNQPSATPDDGPWGSYMNRPKEHPCYPLSTHAQCTPQISQLWGQPPLLTLDFSDHRYEN